MTNLMLGPRSKPVLEVCARAVLLLALGCSSSPDSTAEPGAGGTLGTGGSGATAAGGSATGGLGGATGGGTGGGIGLGGEGGSGGSGNSGSCSDDEKLVYLVGSDLTTGATQLWSFDPAALAFAQVGAVSCPGLGNDPPMIGGGAVDRSGHAWVSMSSSFVGGNTPHQGVYEIDIKSAACKELPNATNTTYLQGATFAADAPGSSAETFFVAYPFGSIDLDTFAFNGIGNLSWVPKLYTAALVGTGNGDLYALAWFPGATPQGQPNPDFELHSIDKTSGDVLTSAKLSSEPIRYAVAWAFAIWGDSLWLFVNQSGQGVNVTRYELSTGTVSEDVAHLTSLMIATAGASTCAPAPIPK
jgi:hypothetical protein